MPYLCISKLLFLRSGSNLTQSNKNHQRISYGFVFKRCSKPSSGSRMVAGENKLWSTEIAHLPPGNGEKRIRFIASSVAIFRDDHHLRRVGKNHHSHGEPRLHRGSRYLPCLMTEYTVSHGLSQPHECRHRNNGTLFICPPAI